MSSDSQSSTVCERCGLSLRPGELRCPVCGMFVHADDGRCADVDRPKVIRCTVCHAAVSYSAEAQNLRCAYCGAVTQVETPTDPIETSELYLPFSVSPEQAAQSLTQFWSRAKWYHKGDIAKKGEFAELRALWWPAWVCSANALFSWTADTPEGARRSDWAPHSGQYRAKIDDFFVSASRGLSDSETTAIAQGYKLQTALSEPQGPSDATVECFEVPRSRGRVLVLSHINEFGKTIVSQNAPELRGWRERKLHVASQLEGLTTVNCCLPAYVLGYRYGGKVYRVVISGQDASCSTGSYPLSAIKILAVIFGIIGLIVLAIVLLSQL